MATNEQTDGGYSSELFVDEPPAGFKCLICLDVVRQPQQHGECGKLFCLSCITQHKETSNDCPHCRQELSTFDDGKSAQEVMAMNVKCENNKNGCNWIGEVRSLEEHMKTCEYVLVPCLHKCMNNGEIEQLTLKDLQNHMANECLRRPYACPQCQKTGEYEEQTTTHLDTCEMVQVHCPNDKCKFTCPRGELSVHCSITCKYQPVLCKFSDLGCSATNLKRKNIQAHEHDDRLHLQITKETVLKLKQVVQQQDKMLARLRENASAHTFMFRGFKQHKEENIDFFSPSLSSHANGYKLCISVRANGSQQSTNLHLSVYAHLVEGEYDDLLTWPFRGSVTVELLNQQEDKNHKRYTINFPVNEEEVSGRVVGQDRGIGMGTRNFIAHSDLDYNYDMNIQYLKDDALFFHVTINVPSSNPWLDCTC